MLVLGVFSLVSLSIECSCMAPLTPAVVVMRGLVFHPLFCMVLISGSYLVCLCMRTCSRDLSWQYELGYACGGFLVMRNEGHEMKRKEPPPFTVMKTGRS